MAAARTLPAALALLALAAAAPGGAPEGSVLAGKHLRVICRFRDDRRAGEALAAAEAGWKSATALLGLPDLPVVTPLEVHLYPDAASFSEEDRARTGGKYAANLAYFHWDTTSAHVAMQPQPHPRTLERLGLPAQTRRMLAWESANVVRGVAAPNHRKHPKWLQDGFAGTAAADAAVALGIAPPDPAEDPFQAQQASRVRRLEREGKLPSLQGILSGAAADLPMYDRYAVHLATVEFLRRGAGPDLWARMMAALPGLPEDRRLGERLAALAEEEPGGWEALSRRFLERVRAGEPRWEEEYRSLETSGEGWTQAAFAENNAVAWRTAPAGAKPYRLSGRLEILQDGRRQANLLLGRREEGFVSVAFVAGTGVTLLRYASKEDRWDTILHRPLEGLAAETPFAFEVRVAGSRVAVAIDGKDVLETGVAGPPLDGPWGLGVQKSCAATWTGVRLASE